MAVMILSRPLSLSSTTGPPESPKHSAPYSEPGGAWRFLTHSESIPLCRRRRVPEEPPAWLAVVADRAPARGPVPRS
jgi:hypothetical protein